MPKSLEIHHIDVAGGDCTVIVLRPDPTKIATTKKILIDGGCFGSGWKRLAGYLKKYFDHRPFDYMIASHYHDDHILGLAKAGVTFKKYLDMGGYEIKGITPYIPKRKPLANSSLGYYNSYVDLVEKQIRENAAERFKLPFLELGNSKKGPVAIEIDTDITLTCYCGDGYLADGTDVIGIQNAGKHPGMVDENDLSLGFLLKWNDFIYYTTADLSGDPTGNTYYNLESPLIDYLKKGVLAGKSVTVAKPSHHGSNYSTYPGGDKITGFLDAIQADTLIVSSNMHKGVPGKSFLMRANTYCKTNNKAILFTNDLVYGQAEGQYAPLESIRNDANITSNLFLDKSNDDQLHNSGPTAVVVQVKADTNTKDLALGKTTTIIERTGYKLYIDSSALPDVKKAALMARGVKLALFFDLDGSVITSIGEGFRKQAEAMIQWIQDDIRTTTEVAKEWLEYAIPAVDIPDLVAAVKIDSKKAEEWLYQKFIALFKETYTFKAEDQRYWPIYDASRLKKQTMSFLLVKNCYQVKLNTTAGWAVETNAYDYSTPVENAKTKQLKRKQVEAQLVENPKRSPRLKKPK